MSRPNLPFGGVSGTASAKGINAKEAQAAADQRSSDWEQALAAGHLPEFVKARLADAGQGRTPWMSTMTPAELLLAKTHGIRPIATVTGTCWYQYGRSWTEGHAAGWSNALARIRAEALACGANAVVDVKMRTIESGVGASMDFTLIGTAVKMAGLPPSTDPVIATVPALEFVRLLEMGIVPAGLAVGARYEWMSDVARYDYATNRYVKTADGSQSWSNQPLERLSSFWERIRRDAHAELRADTARQGTGVLAHTQFSQLLKQEGGENQPDRYLGRHIVIGTVVQTRPRDGVPHGIRTVVDMRDDLSPLLDRPDTGQDIYGFNEQEGGI